MKIKVYNSEKFDRNKWRYVIFVVVFAAVFLVSIINKNVVWIVIMFFLLWGYFYYSTLNSQVVELEASEQWIKMWKKIYSWSWFVGYVLEMDVKTQIIRNIVFVTNNSHIIHTFHDSATNIRDFVFELDKYLPILEEYNQSFLEKLSRKMKL